MTPNHLVWFQKKYCKHPCCFLQTAKKILETCCMMFAIGWVWVQWNIRALATWETSWREKWPQNCGSFWDTVRTCFLFEGPWFRGLKNVYFLIHACSIFIHAYVYIYLGFVFRCYMQFQPPRWKDCPGEKPASSKECYSDLVHIRERKNRKMWVFCADLLVNRENILGGGHSYIFYFYPEIWGRYPFWLIFFNWVETTN